MTWFITHKPAYDAGSVGLRKNAQKRAMLAHVQLALDPEALFSELITSVPQWLRASAIQGDARWHR